MFITFNISLFFCICLPTRFTDSFHRQVYQSCGWTSRGHWRLDCQSWCASNETIWKKQAFKSPNLLDIYIYILYRSMLKSCAWLLIRISAVMTPWSASFRWKVWPSSQSATSDLNSSRSSRRRKKWRQNRGSAKTRWKDICLALLSKYLRKYRDARDDFKVFMKRSWLLK